MQRQRAIGLQACKGEPKRIQTFPRNAAATVCNSAARKGAPKQAKVSEG